MSLNKYMHPKNRYKNAKPSFLHLALKYPDFRAMTTQDESGKVFLDFKNAEALRALTKSLLKEDFGLVVELPTDRLVPTLPLRLNYIHWLEDIVGTDQDKWGIDIGTGASCIYPLLASKMNQWHFLATEQDNENFYHAQKNVKSNEFSHLIHVKHVSDESILTACMNSFMEKEKFDFCMCNPPFFADHMEAQGLTTTRSDDRSEAGSVSTASPQECITTGGEVAFIRQMIEESTVLREKIRVYSSMVGKKSSLSQLKEELKHQKVAKFSTTEFCQGKTMRWGIAWTYDPSVVFPRSQFELRKAKPPLQFVIPQGSGGVEYKVHTLAQHLRQILETIKVHCYQGKQAKAYTSITLTAVENTWCHQRRQRRQRQRENSESAKGSQTRDGPQAGQSLKFEEKTENKDHDGKADKHLESNCENKNCSSVDGHVEKEMADKSDEGLESIDSNRAPKRTLEDPCDRNGDAAKKFKTENAEGGADDNNALDQTGTGEAANTSSSSSLLETESDTSQNALRQSGGKPETCKSLEGTSEEETNSSQELNQVKESDSVPDETKSGCCGDTQVVPSAAVEASSSSYESSQPKQYVLRCVMRLKRAGEKVNLELEWLDGTSRELMHQLFTFMKNKLAQK